MFHNHNDEHVKSTMMKAGLKTSDDCCENDHHHAQWQNWEANRRNSAQDLIQCNVDLEEQHHMRLDQPSMYLNKQEELCLLRNALGRKGLLHPDLLEDYTIDKRVQRHMRITPESHRLMHMMK